MKFGQQLPKSVQALTLEEKFYYFLCHVEEIEQLTLLVGKDKVIKKACNELERFGWSGKELEVYEALQKKGDDYVSTLSFQRKKGKIEGIEIGEKRGVQKGRLAGIKISEKKERSEGVKMVMRNIVTKLLANGMDNAKAAEILGLTLKQLDNPLKA